MRSALTGLLLLLAILPAQDEHPPKLDPKKDAKPLTGHAWTSEGGLRFVWWTPKGFDRKTPRNLTVILHGTGGDYRWGFWNNKPGIFRPDDIVISVDGTSPGQGTSRLFLDTKKDLDAFRDFLAELRKHFLVDRIFLYGHSQGGFFVVHYAGEHPTTVAGVVAHDSGSWAASKTGGDVKKVAIVFQHGTRDPVVPYRQSVGSRDHYLDLKFPKVHLRRLISYNHWPNAVRTNESLAWAQGMTTERPEEALACAEAILEPKDKDEYQWETVVDFAAANAVLGQFEGNGPFAKAKADVLGKAKALRAKIEAEGAKHVAQLKKQVAKPADLTLDKATWLGHLVSLREDFRGVTSVEDYIKSIGFDAAADKHGKATAPLFQAWYNEKSDAAIVRAVLAALPQCFLFEGLPAELGERMNAWKKDASKLGLTKKEQESFSKFTAWEKGWKEGLESYKKLWSQWKP